jgi:EAL domain-containing protein (putative c-di-GMP-specific phosphodiesterase class I)
VAVVAMGCELAQGRLFAPAVAAAEVPEVLTRPRFWWRQPPPGGPVR